MLDTSRSRASSRAGPLVVRFAGDSGDGIQLLGAEFSKSTADADTGFMTFPDYPAEIRAPAGTLFGVSAFQIQFGADEILTSGDAADVLVAFNPAALKSNLHVLKRGGLLIVDKGTFERRGLQKAGLDENPLDGDLAASYQLLPLDITAQTLEALAALDIGRKQAVRAKNFWVLGLIFWLFDRDPAKTEGWIARRFAADMSLREANTTALKAGHAFAETLELAAFPGVAPTRRAGAREHGAPPAREIVSGTQAMALGIRAVAKRAERDVLYCSYPITPASALLHALASGEGGVRIFQAEDEIAAACAAIGASYAGAIGMTASSGPGLSLKTEALGLAVSCELPLIVIDVQRAGPSTGMPTKPEQSDLTLAIHGRHGEAPVPVLAPATPEDCFAIMVEAAEIAISAMTPVIVLSDAYLANAASDWVSPDIDSLPHLAGLVQHPQDGFQPFARDAETLARPWVAPGTPGLAHRIGGLEKEAGSGHISYDPDNHAEMVRLRAEKIARLAGRRAAAEISTGDKTGDLLVVGWGSTYGAIRKAVQELRAEGRAVSHLHLRQLWPLPGGIDKIMSGFKKIVCPELNSGQLAGILRGELLLPVEPLTQVTGQPFRVGDLKAQLERRLES